MIETYESKVVCRESSAIDYFCIDVTDIERVFGYLKKRASKHLSFVAHVVGVKLWNLKKSSNVCWL